MRLQDARRHYRALALDLEQTALDEFVAASTGDAAAPLRTTVYPIERAFEILDNYVCELAQLGLREAGVDAPSAPSALRALVRLRVIGGRQGKTLLSAHAVRNELAHEYPDVRAANVYEAARTLRDELPGYFGDYVRWMRQLGFTPAD